jgi:hypothetical protein
VIRSGSAGIRLAQASAVAGAPILICIVYRAWTLAMIFGALAIALGVAATIFIRKADPAQLRERVERENRFLEAWAKAVGRTSGGWSPIARRPAEERRDRPGPDRDYPS